MKTSYITILSLVAMIAAATCDEAQPVNKEWMVLSARAQNVAKVFQMMPPGGAADPSMFEQDLEVMDSALKKLVKSGDLVEKKIEILSPKKLGDKGLETIFNFAESISEDHGYYVALEMLDIGLNRRLSMMEPDKSITLHLRLPSNQMEKFLMIAAEKGLLVEKSAQQAAPSNR